MIRNFLLLCAIMVSIAASAQESSKLDFTYTQLSGIGYEKGVSRRDASDIIKVKDKYYVYYTKIYGRSGGYWGAIWCAESSDGGYNWRELGEVLGIGEKGTFDSFGVFTPNIIYRKGKYYLYYTAVRPTPGREDGEFENNSTNDYTHIGLAVSDTPSGEFRRVSDEPILRPSTNSNSFDSFRIDDASIIFKNGLYRLYYKGRSFADGKDGPKKTKMGVAFSKYPEGPYIKYPTPVLEGSHEVMVWQYKRYIYALASISSKIVRSDDGVYFNFNFLSKKVVDRPSAPGAFRNDLTRQRNKRSDLQWGISMENSAGDVYLVRYDYLK